MTKEAEAAEAAGFERIELEFEDSDEHNLPKRKAFRGKWICSPKDSVDRWTNSEHTEGRSYAVAITAKGNVVVYTWAHRVGFDSEIGEEYPYTSGYRFLVFSSIQEAALNTDCNYAIREAVKKRGVPVEELDI